MRILIFLLLFSISYASFAWSPYEHMIIAGICYDKLKPAARKQVNQLVYSFGEMVPHYSTFSRLARWPDDIKKRNITIYSHWHYIDIPFSQDGTKVMPSAQHDNALWALNALQPFLYTKRASLKKRAWALALFSHISADLHQPLHTVSRFSAEYPKGDQGGNLFMVRNPTSQQMISLHAMWDQDFYFFTGKQLSMKKTIHNLMKHYPETYFGDKVNDFNFKHWEQESMQIATQFAYNTPENQVPSAEYLKQGKDIADERMVLAGYRLAHYLNQALTPHPPQRTWRPLSPMLL